MYRQVLDPVGDSLFLSSLVAMIPIATLFVLLGGLRLAAHIASPVGLAGREGDLFRKVLGWSLLMLAFMCVLAYLQSTAVLSWMVPS